MKQRIIMLIVCMLAALVLSTACSPGAPGTTSSTPASSLDGSALVQERCSPCHSLSVVEQPRFSASEWKIVVGMMISRGAQLNSAEEAAVVSWLAANFGK